MTQRFLKVDALHVNSIQSLNDGVILFKSNVKSQPGKDISLIKDINLDYRQLEKHDEIVKNIRELKKNQEDIRELVDNISITEHKPAIIQRNIEPIKHTITVDFNVQKFGITSSIKCSKSGDIVAIQWNAFNARNNEPGFATDMIVCDDCIPQEYRPLIDIEYEFRGNLLKIGANGKIVFCKSDGKGFPRQTNITIKGGCTSFIV